MKLKPGDKVNCCIKDNKIVSYYATYDTEVTFEIVAVESAGYYLFIPDHYELKDTIDITDYNFNKYNISKKFLDSKIVYVKATMIGSFTILDGHVCKECQEFSDKSAPNQEDGTFICWSCRNYKKYN